MSVILFSTIACGILPSERKNAEVHCAGFSFASNRRKKVQSPTLTLTLALKGAHP
jgi:hypothetical protein